MGKVLRLPTKFKGDYQFSFDLHDASGKIVPFMIAFGGRPDHQIADCRKGSIEIKWRLASKTGNLFVQVHQLRDMVLNVRGLCWDTIRMVKWVVALPTKKKKTRRKAA
jgi:hypothetical protein